MLQETHPLPQLKRISTSVSLNKARITNTDIQESEMQHRIMLQKKCLSTLWQK